MKKIIVAMDSMKGCLDSYHASLWVTVGIQELLPDAKVYFIPVSDGGEGMMQMIGCGCKDVEMINSHAISPLGGEFETEWLKLKNEGVVSAYIEFASASGLVLVAEKLRNPLDTTSYGTGLLIKDAIKKGIRDIKLGLGGSATVDGGLGILQALGLRLLDDKGKDFQRPITGRMLSGVADIELTKSFNEKIANLKLTLLCDVDAPFTGPNGAAHVFGPQKGADEEEVKFLEQGLERLRRLILDKTGIDLNACPGSGAAGGAAGGLMALAGGVIEKGATKLLDLIGFNDDIDDADLIITGEGSSDRQTLMGKIPYEILKRGKQKGIPVWLVAGRIRDREALLEAGFDQVVCINSPDVVERSKTIGEYPMGKEVAGRRLSSCFTVDQLKSIKP